MTDDDDRLPPDAVPDPSVWMPPDVVVSKETAEVALRELDILIEHTGGPDTAVEDCCSPLALAYDRVERLEGEGIDPFTVGTVLQVLVGVGEERGVDLSGEDPLQDDVFQARSEFRDALGVE